MSDWTDDEYRSIQGFKPPKRNLTYFQNLAKNFTPSPDTDPAPIDWTTRGYVDKVFDQGKCGGCWAFAAVEAMQTHYAIKTGVLLDLSVQQLLDCAVNYATHGCHGGYFYGAFDYARKHGMEQNQHYPYTGRRQPCQYQWVHAVVYVEEYFDVQIHNATALKAALQVGPVAVSVDAHDKVFKYYEGGIITGDCGTHLDHAVLAVGWGIEDGIEYFIVKNSWGPDYGEDGYLRIAVESKVKEGVCGILSAPPSFAAMTSF